MAPTERRLLAIMFSDIIGFTATVARDEAEGIRLRDEHANIVRSAAAKFSGRVVKEIGDGLLVTFPSSLEAVRAGLSIQDSASAEPKLTLRIGIHTGDVLQEAEDVAGDGVNVAARLQPLAPPGQVCVSGRVYEDVHNHAGIRARDLGEQRLKNVGRPIRAYLVSASDRGRPAPVAPKRRLARPWIAVGLMLLGVGLAAAYLPAREAIVLQLLHRGWLPLEPKFDKEIAFTTTTDGVRIAYAVAGTGPPVVIVRGWFTHLERGVSQWVPELLEHHRVVFFDCRGMGLSDRNVEDYSLEGRLKDLEAVVEAAELSSFLLFGESAGGPVAVAYAARHPNRVRRLLLYGTYPYAPTEYRQRWNMLYEVIRAGWGDDNPAFRDLFSKLFVPDANDVFIAILSELARDATTPREAAEFVRVGAEIDVRALAKSVRAPTLIVHREGDQVVALEGSRLMTSLIPNARLRILAGRNHLILPGDPVRAEFIELITRFFAPDGEASG